MAFIFYLLKVILCSGILFVYYLLALRNKRFHQWNRFYLLISVAFSLLIPLISIPYFEVKSANSQSSFQLLNVVRSANDYIDNMDAGKSNPISLDNWYLFVYIIISIFILIPFVATISRLFRITRKYTISEFDGIKFLNTEVKGSPFSFLRYIVWNKQIDLQSETGRQIFKHELVHVQEKHSLDKLFIGSVLILFWCNPFFWLIRREINLVHEFIADEKSIEGKDAAALASMILNAVNPSGFKSIVNPFFQSSIKRRILMLTKSHHPKLNYMSRILALPIVVITFMAFTIKTKEVIKTNFINKKDITVVIDAGHGYINGKQSGASIENIKEDDINFAIAKYIKEINRNNHLHIVLTRNSNEDLNLKDRVQITKEAHADLFLSIHVNAGFHGENGIEVVVSERNIEQKEESRKLGSALVSEIGKEYLTNKELQIKQQGIYVLDKSPCPSALIECGYITNEKDRNFISDESNQKLIAGKILKALELYENSPNSISNSVLPEEKKAANSLANNSDDTVKPHPLLVIDGKVRGRLNMPSSNKIKDDNYGTNPQNIQSINVLKGDAAIKKYGNKGKDGVIEITSKPKSPSGKAS